MTAMEESQETSGSPAGMAVKHSPRVTLGATKRGYRFVILAVHMDESRKITWFSHMTAQPSPLPTMKKRSFMRSARTLVSAAFLVCSTTHAEQNKLFEIVESQPLHEVWVNPGFYSH